MSTQPAITGSVTDRVQLKEDQFKFEKINEEEN